MTVNKSKVVELFPNRVDKLCKCHKESTGRLRIKQTVELESANLDKGKSILRSTVEVSTSY